MDKEFFSYLIQAGGPAAVACLGWWLSGKFREVEKNSQAILDSHEALDNSRHEENLKRFNSIELTIARKLHGHG